MSYEIDAIYDNGILRPLVPLKLPDQARVKLTIDAQTASDADEKIAAQKAALEQLWQEVDKLPQAPNNDGWSAREHDELLYGGK